MSYFCDRDLKLIQNLVYTPSLEPAYDILKDCLVWSDERPDNLTPDGYEKLCDLWLVRAYIHKSLPPSSWGLDPAYFQKAWSDALSANFSWPGFNRIELSDKDRLYYENERLNSDSL